MKRLNDIVQMAVLSGNWSGVKCFSIGSRTYTFINLLESFRAQQTSEPSFS